MGRPLLIRTPGYLALALLVMARVLPSADSRLVGFANIDLWDTVMLRGAVLDALAHPTTLPATHSIFFPVGYPVLQLTPNLLDHLSAAPLVALLPFPLSDNLWWLLVLALDGLAAHRLGRRLGGSEGAGWLAGAGFMLAEPLVRELNLHHAPQGMLFWAPLYLDALLALREAPSLRRAALAGLMLGMAGVSYWYLALFLVLGSLPLLLGLPLTSLAVFGAVAAAISGPLLWPYLSSWGQIPLTAGADAPPPADLPASYAALPAKEAFVAWHGNDLLFWLRRTPADTSNRVSLVLLAAALAGLRKLPRRTAASLAWATLLGAVMLLGPTLRWGEELVLLGGHPVSLPFRWLGQLHPVLERLTWPERWGILVSLGLVGLAARAPRPGLLAVLVAVESFAVSANLPARATELRTRACTTALAPPLGQRAGTGAVLELPLRRPGLQAVRAGVHRRFHRRPMVNAILLPPGATPPTAWQDWMDEQPLLVAIAALEEGRWPDDPGAAAVEQLRDAGVAAIVLDTDPGAVLTPGGLARTRAGLSRMLGAPLDLGCALVWWLDADAPPPQPIDDGDAWRAEALRWKEAHPTDSLDTLISPATDRGGW